MKIYGKNVVSSNQLYDGVSVSGWMPNMTPTRLSSSTTVDFSSDGLVMGNENYAAVIPFDVEYFLSGHSLYVWADNTSYALTWAICTDLSPTSIASDVKYKSNIVGKYDYVSGTETYWTSHGCQIPYNTPAIKALIEGHSTAYLLVWETWRISSTLYWKTVTPADIKVAWSNSKPADTYATTFTSGWFKADQSKDIVVDGTGFFNSLGAESIYKERGNWYNRAQTNYKMRINAAQARVDKNNTYGYYSACFQIPTDAVGKTFYMFVPQFEVMENDPINSAAIITATDPTQNTNYHYGEILTVNWNAAENMATLTSTEDIAGKFVTFQTQSSYHGTTVDYNDCYTNYLAGSSDSDSLRVGNTSADVTVVKPYVATPGWNKVT